MLEERWEIASEKGGLMSGFNLAGSMLICAPMMVSYGTYWEGHTFPNLGE